MIKVWIDQSTLKIDTVSFLNGKNIELTSSPQELVEMYKYMVLTRVFDERALKYQRQGKIGTYAPVRGQEAAQIGSAYALNKEDWIYPSYREVGALIVHGMPMEMFFAYAMGKASGQHLTDLNIFPIQIIIGAQLLHAVGGAWASKLKKENTISVAYMGDGGTSEGDFHEALNFASVYKLPVIFFIQNNQWAISVPISKQMNSKTIAQKALAYGIKGIRVDGNDVIAVNEAMKQAVQFAKNGEPVLFEAVTYRQGPHTTADDPTKYRDDNEHNNWLKNDPIQNMQTYLLSQNLWNSEEEERWRKECEDRVKDAFEKAVQMEKTELAKILKAVTAQPSPAISIQLKEVE